MPRFVSQKDFNFFQHINRELVSDVVDVDVILYKIALETTAVNLYGEATENAKDGFGVDVEQNVEFRFVRALLEQVKTYPEAGDIIYYDEAYYEIDNVNDTQLVAGQPQYTTSILCNAHLTRRSGVQIEEANT
jgi:hypothetical protein